MQTLRELLVDVDDRRVFFAFNVFCGQEECSLKLITMGRAIVDDAGTA